MEPQTSGSIGKGVIEEEQNVRKEIEKEIDRKVKEALEKEYPSIELQGRNGREDEVVVALRNGKLNRNTFGRAKAKATVGLPLRIGEADVGGLFDSMKTRFLDFNETRHKQSPKWGRDENATKQLEEYSFEKGINSPFHNTYQDKYSPNNTTSPSSSSPKDATRISSEANIFKHNKNSRQIVREYYKSILSKVENFYSALTKKEKFSYFHMHTHEGLRNAFKTGLLLDGSSLVQHGMARLRDRMGFVHYRHGPYWPPDYGPLHPTPCHLRERVKEAEPFAEVAKKEAGGTGTGYKACVVYDWNESPKHALPPSECLEFESRFESGNLSRAVLTGPREYELVLREDLYTSGHVQWFYFRLRNMLQGVCYSFKITNLTKKNSLYNQGLRPLLYSELKAVSDGVGWRRVGEDLSYYRTPPSSHLSQGRSCYTLSWSMTFPHEGDTCYMAHCYPYTYTDLQEDLILLSNNNSNSQHLQIHPLCLSVAGNTCFIVTITEDLRAVSVASEEKRVVFITARVHPGESNSSLVVRGILFFLTTNHMLAKELRRAFIFKIVPMMNPDGVVVGNYRCSLAGVDLNRRFALPSKQLHPSIFHLKKLIQACRSQVLLYCDIHGHNQKNDVFMYGCPSGGEEYLQSRVLPWLMAKQSPGKFSFSSCDFEVRKSKQGTGRCVVHSHLNVATSYTLEATFCGSYHDKVHFNDEDYQEIGVKLCAVVAELRELEADSSYKMSIYAEIKESMQKDGRKEDGKVVKEDYHEGSASFGRNSEIDASENSSSDEEEEEEDEEHRRRLYRRVMRLKKLMKTAKTKEVKVKGKNDSYSFMVAGPMHKEPSKSAKVCKSSVVDSRDETAARRGIMPAFRSKWKNRFEGKHNHGIPCFVDLRMCERAAKKKVILPAIKDALVQTNPKPQRIVFRHSISFPHQHHDQK